MTREERVVLILEHQDSISMTMGSAMTGFIITMMLLFTVGKDY